ncbi:DUF6639 family protein [Aestuariicoccus sp. MJ-SS9]|uniref:DUF6639 family protein n=1 Tax=Aestuariicoccus sp. MJ-SS9 TaxID=3079855 RepID=UPI002908F9BB|nr:DUF6639 family protein [Aestuariicoccus sp. MJ-SS9]MDU8910386.1 DUF6639 family protein [Aestuariicoccus sp. MJ-SS9]
MQAILRLALAGALAFLTGAPVWAEQALACEATDLTVEVPDPDLAARVCATAQSGLDLLAEFGLVQSKTIRIQVGSQGALHDTDCMGSFDAGAGLIRLSDPATLARSVNPGSLWHRIDAWALFDSLVIHELSHALLQQADRASAPCLADHEYVAYAAQLSSLAPADRALVLDGSREERIDPAHINDFIVLMDPDLFARAVWQHFSAPGHGAAFVRGIVAGRLSFYVEPF